MDADTTQEVHNTSQNSRARKAKGKPPKLRASCDRCSNAKIRCDQSRPSCQRCLYIHSQCNYSASRRMGKPPVRRTRIDKEAKIAASATKSSKAESYCSDTASESSESQRNETQQLPDAGLGTFGQDFDFSTLQSWNDANFLSDLANASNFAGFPDLRANNSQLTLSQLPTAQLPAEFQDHHQNDFVTQFHEDSSSKCIRTRPRDLLTLQQPTPDLLDISNTTSDPIDGIVHQKTSSCAELASSTLNSLSLPSGICASSPQPIPLHTVEQVLTTSRGAMSAFNALLQCPCSQLSSFALTLALIISKILDCYSAICRCSTPSATNDIGQRKATPSARDLPTPSSSISALHPPLSPPPTAASSNNPAQFPQNNIILDTPIAVGGYTVDPDDQHLFIQQLILSELRKVGRLIDAFVGHYSSSAVNNKDPIDTNRIGNGRVNFPGARTEGESLYKSLERFLRYQVQKARRDVGAVLRGNVESGQD